MPDFLTEPFVDSAPIAGDAVALQQRAAESGYLYFPGLLPAATVMEMRLHVTAGCQELSWLVDDRPPEEAIVRPGQHIGHYDDPDYLKLAQHVLSEPGFAELGRHPAIIAVLEKLHGRPVETDLGAVIRAFGPGQPALATRPHQEHFYVGGSTELWTAWLPLGDCPAALGGLAVLPASHRQGSLEHIGETSAKYVANIPEDATWAFGDYACGDVLMFNCLTLHQAAPNLTADRLRLSADFRYRPSPA